MLRALPRSDEAFADESVLGYAMRMAELNRVNGLEGTARLLGCGSVVRGGASHATAIGLLYGASPSRLVSLAPQRFRRNGELHVSLLGCEFSRPWLLRSQRPQVCPQCLTTHGYVRADWDLLFVTQCRVHWTRLLDQCPSCKEPLHWRRKTLKRCTCGSDLSAIGAADTGSCAAQDLTAWLASRLGLPAASRAFAGERGWLGHLDALSVDGALLLVWAFGVRRTAADIVDPGRTHGPIATLEVNAIVERARSRLEAVSADGASAAQDIAATVHVSALVSLALRGLAEGDRRIATQLLARLGYRTWKNGRLRNQSPQAQLELFTFPPASVLRGFE
ncbi:MAG: hypothetical protein CL725_10595 [Chloroflexi bacterium]|mgnify:CR=1 FL=1|nr:hypothetical protein [Chloroflexota bacterium]|tara:strand:+ start:25410 stop:26411 length:1002 start_codon:yes stop_codon:yes gene_type:complete